MKRIKIDLDNVPVARWAPLKPYREEIDILIKTYLKDLGDASFFTEMLSYYKQVCIPSYYLEELEGIASFSSFGVDELLTANLYYDALKLVLGCTAFSVHTGEVNLHARNLDWWSDDNSLSSYSKIFDFEKNGKIVFSSIGWPGFTGVLSGIKPQKYAVSLNAVLSVEPPVFAPPITFKIREALENIDDYKPAVDFFASTVIASDCLLLVTGKEKDERAVIERTPKRNAVRKPNERDVLVVTNAYLELINKNIQGDVLQESSNGRQGRAVELLEQTNPKTDKDCLRILSDEQIKMGMTMQQMVFNINKGTITLKTK